jgi:hypothetical protein
VKAHGHKTQSYPWRFDEDHIITFYLTNVNFFILSNYGGQADLESGKTLYMAVIRRVKLVSGRYKCNINVFIITNYIVSLACGMCI